MTLIEGMSSPQGWPLRRVPLYWILLGPRSRGVLMNDLKAGQRVLSIHGVLIVISLMWTMVQRHSLLLVQ